jgi:hypothetical protein
MRERYDGNPGKDARMAKVRQERMEAEHSSKNQFVKREQEKIAAKSGRVPNLKGEAMETNAYMCNNGMHAQEFARELTKGIDHEAFPVK